MLLQLGRSLAAPHREAILSSCMDLGYAVRFLDDEQRLLQLDGPGAPGHRAQLTDLTGVVRVVDEGEPHELALRDGDHAEDSMIPVGNARFGAGNLSLIAGPCAVEDEERLEEIARGVLRTGAWLLRAGAFKPRTSPYSFQGIGVEGLEILDRVGGGDSFASGLAFGFLSGKDAAYAVECGAAHGALAMTTPGDTSTATLAEVERVMAGGAARVQR